MSSVLVRLLAIGLMCFTVLSGAEPIQTEIQTPVEARRGVEQTLLTFPEWFLVFSPYEYGEYLASGAGPSGFPFYGHLAQFWQSYYAVASEAQTRKLDLNPGYHLMIMVIGVSTTVEYALKSAYESLIGRLTESKSTGDVPEDRYAARVAQDYVRFIRLRPWYEYDFGNKLMGLWRSTPLWGEHPIRSWERKYALTTEYVIKMIYAKVIGLCTAGVYEPALQTTLVVLQDTPRPVPTLPDMLVLKHLDNGAALVSLPRYQEFTKYAEALAAQGNNFTEIAGNSSFIEVSVLTRGAWIKPKGATELFAQPILTMPGLTRHVLVVPVIQLAECLGLWRGSSVEVEHVFDY